MPKHLKLAVFVVAGAAIYFSLPVIIEQSNSGIAWSPVSLAAAAEGHDSHDGGHDSSHDGSAGKGKGPSYKGGRSIEGHDAGDSAHKGSSSHGGGSKTLEDVIFDDDHEHDDDTHEGARGKQFKGDGRGGHESSSEEGSHDHESP